ncbi:MAG: LptA/OstA family protein [Terriglobales bacterium]
MEPVRSPALRLQRHRRVVRLRRLLAAALVVGAVAVGADYVRVRRRGEREFTRRPGAQVAALGLDIEQSAAGVTISKSEQGRPVFRITAARAEKLRSGGRDMLHQVSIQVYGEDGRESEHISGQQFAYNEHSGELTAAGPVQVALNPEAAPGGAAPPLQLSLQQLDFNVTQGRGSAQGIRFRYGSSQGTAAAAALDSRKATVELSGGVRLRWPRPGQGDVTASSGAASLERLIPRAQAAAPAAASVEVTLRQNARVESAGERSERLEADVVHLRFGANRGLQQAAAAGHVRLASDAPGRQLQLTAGQASARFSGGAQPALRQMELWDGVHGDEQAGARSAQLQAGAMTLWFGAGQQLERIQARQQAQVRLGQPGAVGAAGTLAAPTLVFAFAPSAANAGAAAVEHLSAIETQGRALLVRGADQAWADHLQVQFDPRQQPERVTAAGDVELRQQTPGGIRTSRSDRLMLTFAPAPGAEPQLAQATASGQVMVRTLAAGGRSGGHAPDPGGWVSADQVNYDAGRQRAVLDGHVRGGQGASTFSARHAVWTEAADGSARLQATGAVAVSTLAGGAGLSAPGLTPGATAVITARQLDWRQPPGKTAPAAGRAGALLGPRSGVARFRGGVRLIEAPNLLQAGELQFDTAAQTLAATGGVTTTLLAPAAASPASPVQALARRGGRLAGTVGEANPAAVTITATSLHYSGATQQALYSGAVHMRLGASLMDAPQLLVRMARQPAGIERAVAGEGVKLTEPGRIATGKQLTYVAASGQVTMTGDSPSIFDAEHGKISGDPLTFSLVNDEIQVGSKSGKRASGMTIAH